MGWVGIFETLKQFLLCAAELMLQACGHMAEMPFKQQSYCSCNRVFTQTKHKHVPVLLTTGKNKPTFDPSNLSRTPLRVHSLWRGLRRVWRGVFYLAPFFQEEHPGSCDSEHSPELLEDHLRQEEYDRCEHDVGTFRNQKWQWLLVLQNTTRQMLKGKVCVNVGFFKDPMWIPCVY